MNKFCSIVLSIGLLGISVPFATADNLLITGADTTSTSSNYYFVGALIPLPDNSMAHGLVMHLWTDYLEYSYDSGLVRIQAKANSVSAAIAYHDSGEDFWWNVKMGVSRGNTRLSPDDLGNDSRGNVNDLKIGLAGERHLSSTFKINGILDYGVDRESYWSRARLLKKFGERMYHGPEVISQGDPSYEIQQYGWAIEGIPLLDHSSLGVKAGKRKDGNDTTNYIGVDMVVFY